MGKNKVIDREATLVAAERIVRRSGSEELSHGNLAAEAGISKGGVQSCFGTKHGLVDAMLERWIQDLDRRTISGPHAGDAVTSFVLSRLYPDDACLERVASLLAALSRNAESLESLRNWHREHLHLPSDTSEKSASIRLAFFAAQGLFITQYLGMMDAETPINEAVKQDILGIIDARDA